MTYRKWRPIIERADEIVRSYSIPVTLRQLFYRLVSEELINNTDSDYGYLSSRTAELRRHDQFPALFDRNRAIIQPNFWTSPANALTALHDQYRRDHTEGQDYSIFVGVEKNALAGLLSAWFEDYGLPVLPLGGFASEGLERQVRDKILGDGRKAILLYAGDFDASGIAIGRAFYRETQDCWYDAQRIGLSEAQIYDLALPVLRGKPTDNRAPGFIREFPQIHDVYDFGRDDKGRHIPVQVELDAVDPDELHRMFTDQIDQIWDQDVHQSVLDQEEQDRQRLAEIIEGLNE